MSDLTDLDLPSLTMLFATEDHARLAMELRRFQKARVVVSYYDHPQLAELYPDWTQHKIEVSKALSHQGQQGKNDTTATEVLLVNDHVGLPLFAEVKGEQ